MEYEPWLGHATGKWWWYRATTSTVMPWLGRLPSRLFLRLPGATEEYHGMNYPTRQHALQALAMALWRLEVKQ